MIGRDPSGAAAREHDLVIVGGGIYGACLTLEAARRGLRPLLLERGDFGGETSWSSLRILHGGFRYLQSLDLRRFRESVDERRWFCRTFPELVRPQECLMPLYGEGLKRPLVFAAALAANDLLSARRNAGVDPTTRLGRGRVLSVAETVSRAPAIDRRSLRGAGLWYDARMLSSQRVLIEMLRWACRLGATALNYVEATGLERQGAGIGGVHARDVIGGGTYTFPSAVVCNCAGPWSAEVAERFDRPAPRLFRPSIAFNVLLDREPPCESALAVTPRRDGKPAGPVYFVYPAFGRLLAGTVHAPATTGSRCDPSHAQLQAFVDDLNAAMPGLDARLDHVVRVFAGLLPVSHEGTARLAVRPVIRDHGLDGGPQGLVSVSGVKFTTARRVAEQTLAALGSRFGRLPVRADAGRPPLASGVDIEGPAPRAFAPEQIVALQRLMRDEAVMTMDDLLYRRTNWAVAERDVSALSRRIERAIGWPDGLREGPVPATSVPADSRRGGAAMAARA